MIFVSTGTQFPFDRLIEIIDNLAPSLNEEIVVQAISGKYKPRNLTLLQTIKSEQYNSLMDHSRVVLAHAGMGTILNAMLKTKPIIIFPRRYGNGEHRNDHQLATTDKFQSMGYVYVANTEDEVRQLLSSPSLHSLHSVGEYASPGLTDFAEQFIANAAL